MTTLDLSTLDVLEEQTVTLPTGDWRRLVIAVDHLDLAGSPRRARAQVFLPPSLRHGDVDSAPLIHVAGYELGASVAVLLLGWWTERQPILVNPMTPTGEEAWPGDNAMARGFNLDAALLRLARALPFVDDSRVVVTGISAGGLTSLMVAAETFPLAGVAPDVAPLDMGFTATWLLHRNDVACAIEDAGSELGPRREVAAVMHQASLVLGDDPLGEPWREHAPLGRLPLITAPVSLVMSSADMLVPIAQVGSDLVPPHDPDGFPEALVLDPAALVGGAARPRLLELLDPADVTVHHVPIPETTCEIRPGTPLPPEVWLHLDIPASDRQWDVIVLDEGPPLAWVDHMRFATLFERNAFLHRAFGPAPIAVEQLTEAKLRSLVDRHLGVEWSATGVRHLGDPASEQADVERGIRTYCAQGPAHAEHFHALHDALPIELRVLA